MPAQGDVVRDVHEVVELRPLPDHRRPEGRAVDRDVGADLDLVLDHHRARVTKVDMLLAVVDIAEPAAPDDGAGMDDARKRQMDPVVERDVRVDDRLLPDLHVVSDRDQGVELQPACQSAPLSPPHSGRRRRAGSISAPSPISAVGWRPIGSRRSGVSKANARCREGPARIGRGGKQGLRGGRDGGGDDHRERRPRLDLGQSARLPAR